MTRTIPIRIISQIIPATGWYARYKLDDGSISEEPLACWALVAEENAEASGVFGMYGGDFVDFCENASTFDGYVGPSNPLGYRRLCQTHTTVDYRHAWGCPDCLVNLRARNAALVKALERIASFENWYGPDDEAVIARAALAADAEAGEVVAKHRIGCGCPWYTEASDAHQ